MSDADASLGLRVEGVSKRFDVGAGAVDVLKGVSLTLEPGQAIAITGPSGSGKSTLLHLVGGLDRPTAGQITVLGVHPQELDAEALARFRNRTVGFVFQESYLLPQCSALENALLPTLAGDGANAEVEGRARAMLERVGLGNRLTHRPAQLSGGERQRVALARALILKPPLLLCDEPTGNLDHQSGSAVGGLLLELAREHGSMLIVVTHSDELARRLPRRCELRDGLLRDVAA